MASDSDQSSSRSKIVYFKNEVLYLACEWGNCQYVEQEMKPFANHVYNHLQELPTTNLQCYWADCGYVSGSAEEKTRHITFHAFHTKLKCLGTSFLQRANVGQCILSNSDRNIIPELPGEFFCLWQGCMTPFNDICEFFDHVKQHTEQCPKNKLCRVTCDWDGCNNKFENQRRLRDHLRSHTEEKVAACSVCGGIFSNRTKLSDHVQRMRNKKTYKCTFCPKLVATERLLRDHERGHINDIKCPYCDMTCSSPSSLNSHIMYRHTEEKPFACAHCNHKTKTKNDLRKHLQKHSAQVPYHCHYPNCKYASRSNHSVTLHIRKWHEELTNLAYRCHICEKTYTRGSYLSKHLMTVHKYKRPSGHAKFSYEARDNYYHLQMVRLESVEIAQALHNNQECEDSLEAEDHPTLDGGTR